MIQNMTWLSISLFSNQPNWHKLLSQGIKSFIESQKKIHNYTIEFNYLSGENIRLSLMVKEAEAPFVVKEADSYFKHFFSKSNFSVKEVKLPVEGVFMPFPVNIIQYGLYKTQESGNNETGYNIATDLSKIVTAALTDDTDDETIITLAFYLQMGLIRAIHNYTSNIDELLSTINQVTPVSNANTGDDSISDDSLMDEITIDVMQTEDFDSELNWLTTWIKLGEEGLRNLNSTNADKNLSIKNFYNTRINEINRCLGLNTQRRNLLRDLIKVSLKRYFILNK